MSREKAAAGDDLQAKSVPKNDYACKKVIGGAPKTLECVHTQHMASH